MSLARTRIAVRLIAIAALAALTAGCFQPMYAERSDGKPALREKLMGVELPPVDKPNASREARIQVEIGSLLLLANVTQQVYQMARAAGYGKEDGASVVKVLERLAGVTVGRGD